MCQYDSDHSVSFKAEREKQLRSAMAKRGYGVMCLGSSLHPMNLYIHRICGAAVANPDAHDRYCPAKAAPGFLED